MWDIKKFFHRNFLSYFGVGVLSVIISTTLLVIMVDGLGMWVAVANIIQTIIVFILKYVLYDKAGMLKWEKT
jgi:putative flippase GtrA